MLQLSFDSSPAASPLWIVGAAVPPGYVVYFHSIGNVMTICIGLWMSEWQKLWLELDDDDTFFFHHLTFIIMSTETLSKTHHDCDSCWKKD